MSATSKLAPSAYDIAVSELLALGHELHNTPSHKFDLENMRVLLEAMGHPERRFASVLIAGTNGKGSTAATLASILRAADHRVGLYTSPHLVRVNERIRLDGEDISDAEFAEMHRRVAQAAQQLVAENKLPWHPSFFEMLTAIAFEYFASVGAQIVVLEVGMGGRLDATNVVEPCVAVITDIALDHQNYLGNTITEIAREKAGIIRPKGVVVTLPQHPEANDVIGNTILERGAKGVSAAQYVPPVNPNSSFELRVSSFKDKDESKRGDKSEGVLGSRNTKLATSYPLAVLGEEITIASPLSGRHQLRNVALAIAAAVELKDFGFQSSARQIEQGISTTRWPGRLQVIPASKTSPELLLDVAHNPAGAWALRSALSQYYEGHPLIFVFGAMRDKAIGEVAEILFPLAEKVIATRAENPRSATPEEIQAAASRSGAEILCEPDVTAALARARSLTPHNGVVVITGSIYIVGEALAALGGR